MPFGGSGHSLPEEQPARRKRRNSLVVVQSVATNVCLANTADNGYQSHNDADEELQRSIVVQQLDGVVDEGAVEREPRRPAVSRPSSPPLSRLVTAHKSMK